MMEWHHLYHQETLSGINYALKWYFRFVYKRNIMLKVEFKVEIYHLCRKWHDLFMYCESPVVLGNQFSWFLWVSQTKIWFPRKRNSHWFVHWKSQNNEFKNPQTDVSFFIHEYWHSHIKVLSHYYIDCAKFK